MKTSIAVRIKRGQSRDRIIAASTALRLAGYLPMMKSRNGQAVRVWVR